MPGYMNEKLTATRHANGRDWWIITQAQDVDTTYRKLLITPQGIQGPFLQKIGPGDHARRFFGQMVFSLDGSTLAAASANSTIDIFDFDRCTGMAF